MLKKKKIFASNLARHCVALHGIALWKKKKLNKKKNARTTTSGYYPELQAVEGDTCLFQLRHSPDPNVRNARVYVTTGPKKDAVQVISRDLSPLKHEQIKQAIHYDRTDLGWRPFAKPNEAVGHHHQKFWSVSWSKSTCMSFNSVVPLRTPQQVWSLQAFLC